MGDAGIPENPQQQENLTYPTLKEIKTLGRQALIERVVRLLDDEQKPSLEAVEALISRSAQGSGGLDNGDEFKQVSLTEAISSYGENIAVGSKTFPEGIADYDDFDGLARVTFAAMERLELEDQVKALNSFLNLIDDFDPSDIMEYTGSALIEFVYKSPSRELLGNQLLNHLYDREDELKYNFVNNEINSSLDSLAWKVGSFFPELLVGGLRDERDEAKALQLFGLAATLSREQTVLLQSIRNVIGNLETDEEAKTRLERIGKRALGFSPDDARPFHLCLESVYGSVKFEDYEINRKVQEKELKMVGEVIAARPLKEGIILDLACGTGRIANGLAQKDKEGKLKIVGIDISESQIKKAQDLDSTGRVEYKVGNWLKTELPDNSVSFVCLLGRSIQHATRGEFHWIIQEMTRLLPVGGQILMDLGDPNVGAYLENRQKSLATAVRIGAKDRDTGEPLHRLEQIDWVVDSPDGVNYYDRWAPQIHEIMEDLRFWGNFEVSVYQVSEIPDGKGSQNIYLLATRQDRMPPRPARLN